jgi:hypothetical protein
VQYGAEDVLACGQQQRHVDRLAVLGIERDVEGKARYTSKAACRWSAST